MKKILPQSDTGFPACAEPGHRLESLCHIPARAFVSMLGLALALAAATIACAQQMPQDNWRYDGVEFAGPDTAKALRSIAVGTGGVYVGYGDPATSIVQFQEDGTYIRTFGTFTYILGIACDSAGNVYVLDRGDSKIKAFDKDGNALRSWGGPGSGDGQLSLASASYTTMIAVDKNNRQRRKSGIFGGFGFAAPDLRNEVV